MHIFHTLPFSVSHLKLVEAERCFARSTAMSLGFLAVGCLFLVAGVAYLAYLMELPEIYVLGPALLLVGIAAATGAQSVRRSRV
jgi:hypothetical protein